MLLVLGYYLEHQIMTSMVKKEDVSECYGLG